MFKYWQRLRSQALRLRAGLTSGRTSPTPQRGQDILGAVWAALNIARDNKALVITRAGIVADVNPLVSHLCGRSREELIGAAVTKLFDSPLAPSAERWETALKTSSGIVVAVEITRQSLDAHLPGTEVYAIRDLRERHQAAEERERQRRAL